MARPVSVTKDKILAAALDVVRKGGASNLTARSLTSALGCGANAIFSAYGSMEGVLCAVKSEARRLFRERISEGFSLNPPFKGFGLALLWFAMDEPQLYKIVMEEKVAAMSIEDYIDAHIGFKVESVAAINQSFGLQEKDAVYYSIGLQILIFLNSWIANPAEQGIRPQNYFSISNQKIKERLYYTILQ